VPWHGENQDWAESEAFVINAGLNDAWYNPETSGQGFYITVFPDLGAVSLAWFTYDTDFPPANVVANLGDPGHRWLTAVGPIIGNQVTMDVEMTSGGLFDTPTEIQRTDPPGSDGTSWKFVPSDTEGMRWDVWGSGPNNVFSVGDVAGKGLISNYNGTDWTTMLVTITPTLQGAWGSSENDIFAVGGGRAMDSVVPVRAPFCISMGTPGKP
jgi:hypothetical protein